MPRPDDRRAARTSGRELLALPPRREVLPFLTHVELRAAALVGGADRDERGVQRVDDGNDQDDEEQGPNRSC